MNVMERMGVEAAEKASGWLAEAEAAFGLSGHGGVVEVVRRLRAEVEALPSLASPAGMRTRPPTLAHA